MGSSMLFERMQREIFTFSIEKLTQDEDEGEGIREQQNLVYYEYYEWSVHS